jgi:hypothetical protein
MIRRQSISKECGSLQILPRLRYYPGISLDRLSKATEEFRISYIGTAALRPPPPRV